MFDDLNQNNNSNKSDSGNLIQSNLAENYQEKLKNNSFAKDSTVGVDDIFSETDNSSINANVRRIIPQVRQEGLTPANPITDYSQLINEVESSDTSKIRPIYFIIGILVLVVIIGGAGFWVYETYFKNNKQSVKVDLNNSSDPIQVDNNTNNVGNGINVNSSSVNEDTDGDGLKNDEEEKIGTDKTKSDTDADGLFDRDEVKVYSTDPNNPDTDGDGYRDGYDEVNKGYNPLGPGRLLNFDFMLNSDTEIALEIKELSSTKIDTSTWKSYDDKDLSMLFKYPNTYKLSKKGSIIYLADANIDIISIEVRENKLSLDLVDWMGTQYDFPNFKQQEINVNGISSLALSSDDPKWGAGQSIFVPIDKNVFCFNYLDKKVDENKFKEFQEVVLSFSFKK